MVFVVQYHDEQQSVQVPRRYKAGDRLGVPSGADNTSDLNLEIKRLIKQNGDDENGITVQPNYSTLKLRVILANDYKVDFTLKNGLIGLMGFDVKVLQQNEVYDSENKSTSPISTRC